MSRSWQILDGAVLSKRGQIQEGLTTIATAVAPRGVTFTYRSIEEVRRHLVIIGVPQKTPFTIELGNEQISELVHGIEKEIADAKQNKRPPWKGRDCSVSDSSVFNQQYQTALFDLGLHEFDGNLEDAIRLGLHVGSWMLEHDYFHDAIWIVENVLENPAIVTAQRGHAHALLAQGYAAVGALERSTPHLTLATQLFQETREELSPPIADFGLWHSMSLCDPESGAFWAQKLGEALSKHPDRCNLSSIIAAKIDSWGESMAAVGKAFRNAAATSGITLPPHANAAQQAFPFHNPPNLSADFQQLNVEGFNTELAKIQDALFANDVDQALALLMDSRDNSRISRTIRLECPSR